MIVQTNARIVHPETMDTYLHEGAVIHTDALILIMNELGFDYIHVDVLGNKQTMYKFANEWFMVSGHKSAEQLGL